MAAGSSTGWMNDGGSIGSGSAVPRSPSLRSMRATLKPDPKRSVSTVVSRTGCGSSPSISPSLVAWAACEPWPHLHPHGGGKAESDPHHDTIALDASQDRSGEHQRSRHRSRHRTRRPLEATRNYDRWVSSGPNGPLRHSSVAWAGEISLVERRSSCTLFGWPPSAGSSSSTGSPASRPHATHKDEIDVESWSWGVSHPASSSGGGGGGGAGKASFEDFHFVSRISKASPALFTACASGSHIKEGLLSGNRGVGQGQSTISSTSSATWW